MNFGGGGFIFVVFYCGRYVWLDDALQRREMMYLNRLLPLACLMSVGVEECWESVVRCIRAVFEVGVFVFIWFLSISGRMDI